ncbi:M56 family metallopeptidase [Sphingobacterium suaedae]|uniref:TonB-dependent receptor plug domain-containing protein n=1 Tax=Sphingobacterium suaedae TaxID=1686402 RepID=A0ABW5KKG6_9SPHI
MHSLLAYIVQVNILLAIVYVGYTALLKSLTFYPLNRIYFVAGGVFSLSYPFLDIKALFQQHLEPVGELIDFLPAFHASKEDLSVYTVENLIYMCVAAGVLFFAVKLLIQLISLLRIHVRSVDATWKSYWYRNVLFPIVPFSFLNTIYLNKEQHQEQELYDIFEHENIHVKGLHTIDILLFEIVWIGCWYNPFVWLMRRAVRQNLEFLTDQQVLNKGVDRQAYQYSLLRVSREGAAVGISNQFNFKLLKKRIMMMNKRRSSTLELSKYACLLPIIIFAAGAFTISKADGHIVEVVQTARQTDLHGVLTPDSMRAVNGNGEAGQVLKEALGSDTIPLKIAYTGGIEDSGSDTVAEKRGRISVKHAVEGMAKVSVSNKNGLTFRGGGLQGPNSPLVIVDDKIQVAEDLDAMDPHAIERIEVFKDISAVAQYGERGRNGVIKVTTKEYAKALSGKVQGVRILSDTSRRQPVAVRGYTSTRGSGFVVQADTSHVKTVKVRGVKDDNLQPLIVVDGVPQAKGYGIKTGVAPDKIESVTVLKNDDAKSIYGEKAAHGVVLIATKANGSSVSKGKNTYTDNDVFFVDGNAVSKNEFKAVPEKDILTIETKGERNKQGRRVEIKTK